MIFKRIVNKEGIRVDKYLFISGLGLSRAQIQRLIKNQQVKVDGKVVKPHTLLRRGMEVEVNYEKPTPIKITPEEIPLDIVYEDEHLIVVNKPPNMVTHPAPGNLTGTLVNALLHHCSLPTFLDRTRPGVLHRLDKDTSGLIMFAKTTIALQELAEAISKKEVERIYLAFIWGKLGMKEGVIDAPLGRHPLDKKRISVTPLKSREALTHYKVIEEFENVTQVEVRLKTGRTHQIRVHFQHIDHPVVGDPTYGGRECPHYVKWNQFTTIMSIIGRQALHAIKLQFVHPVTKKNISLTSTLPPDIKNLIKYLKKESEG